MAEDRTSEFLSLAQSLPESIAKAPTSASSLASNASGRYSHNDSSFVQLRDFHKTAGGISRDIAGASAMLGELTRLVRQKSLFQDDTQKVNDLVVRIKSSIENLNGRLDEAGRQIAQQKRMFGKNSQVGQQTTNLVAQLKEEFGQAAGGFKVILQQRTDAMKETTDRKREIYGTDDDIPNLNLENKPPVYGDSNSSMGLVGFPTLDLTSGMTTGEPTSSGSQLPRPHGTSSYDAGMRLRKASSDIPSSPYGSSNYYGRQDSTPLTPYDIQRMEQESGQDQMMQLIPDQDYLRERADAMEQVESNIVELGTIFNKLAVMVNEHKEMVQRVEDNVDDANATINFSLNTLTDTLTSLQTNRALFLKCYPLTSPFAPYQDSPSPALTFYSRLISCTKHDRANTINH
eukprot:scaffold25455_cov152-Cylindrotheca_fusiformis.AAC.4